MSIPEEVIASSVVHRFLLIHRHLRQYSRQMDNHGIRPRQFSVLRFLLEQGTATVGEVQQYMYASASTASSVISDLETDGYVTRTRSDEDNRVVNIELTAAGREIAEQTPVGGIPLLRRRLAHLPEDRLRLIDTALEEIMQLMEVTDSE